MVVMVWTLWIYRKYIGGDGGIDIGIDIGNYCHIFAGKFNFPQQFIVVK